MIGSFDKFLQRWLRFNNVVEIGELLRNLGCENIAIYGGGIIGRILYEQLYHKNICVHCIIDINKDLDFPYDVKVIQPQELRDWKGIETIIVTPILSTYDFLCIKHDLMSLLGCQVHYLHDLIIDIDELDCLYKVVDHVENSQARLLVMKYSEPIFSMINPTEKEYGIMVHRITIAIRTLLPLTERSVRLLRTYYDDIPNVNDEYIKDVYTTLYGKFYKKNGVTFIEDVQSEYFNVIEGSRFTTDTPQVYDNRIIFFGNCIAVGYYTEDKYTIESYLQRLINSKPLYNRVHRVQNNSNTQYYYESMKQILTTELHSGDLVIIIDRDMTVDHDNDVYLGRSITGLQHFIKSNSVYFFDISCAFDRPHNMGEVFFDNYHTNHRGYKLIADKVYSILLELPDEDSDIDTENSLLNDIQVNLIPKKEVKELKVTEPIKSLNDYIETLSRLKTDCQGTIGSVVMNCNPFTLGHRYLIDIASKDCDFLYIFVVEEDKSFFSFADRLMLVKSGTSDICNVKVIPSGRFIISSFTLPEYFSKEVEKYVKIDASKDLETFAKFIAPTLSITKRYVGEEPFDPITKQYNQAMLELLPKYGIEVIEIQRKQSLDGLTISAQYVRKLLKENSFSEIAKIVPKTTMDYLAKYWNTSKTSS